MTCQLRHDQINIIPREQPVTDSNGNFPITDLMPGWFNKSFFYSASHFVVKYVHSTHNVPFEIATGTGVHKLIPEVIDVITLSNY
ncbi:unnamed protein product [Schistosoma margrebowiei]|uniref:Uncharacterized protein n=1 Tax=Schistosoma margrebowiei TaxID=48269 RepID=A0A183M3F9_9TREM|nr:unnamed protein product [Schistosoma margrebowiei]